MKTVGVVIPIYNVEKYLRECLDSVVNQTYKNLQVVLVNDGSTDENSLNIAKEYTLKDKRFILFDKENGGQSTARNVGIEFFSKEYDFKNITQELKKNSLVEFKLANEDNPYNIYKIYKSSNFFKNKDELLNFKAPNIDYIIFLDSDDYWELNCIEECVPRMDGVEVVWFDHHFDYDLKEKHYKYRKELQKSLIELYKYSKSQKITSVEWLNRSLYINTPIPFWWVWAGMIDFNFLKKIHLKFINGFIHEDHHFGIVLFAQCDSIFILKQKLYYYRITKATTSAYDDNITISNIPSCINYLYQEFDKNAKITKKYYMLSSILMNALYVYDFMKNISSDSKKEKFERVFFNFLYMYHFGLFEFKKDPLNMLSKLKKIHPICQKNILSNREFYFYQQYGTAISRIKAQLNYKIGLEILDFLKNKQNFFILIKKISFLIKEDKKQKEIYKQAVQNDPSLKLPSLELYPDYKEAAKIQNHLSYKLGEAFLKCYKSKYKISYIKLPWNIFKAWKEFKQEKKRFKGFIDKSWQTIKIGKKSFWKDYDLLNISKCKDIVVFYPLRDQIDNGLNQFQYWLLDLQYLCTPELVEMNFLDSICKKEIVLEISKDNNIWEEVPKELIYNLTETKLCIQMQETHELRYIKISSINMLTKLIGLDVYVKKTPGYIVCAKPDAFGMRLAAILVGIYIAEKLNFNFAFVWNNSIDVDSLNVQNSQKNNQIHYLGNAMSDVKNIFAESFLDKYLIDSDCVEPSWGQNLGFHRRSLSELKLGEYDEHWGWYSTDILPSKWLQECNESECLKKLASIYKQLEFSDCFKNILLDVEQKISSINFEFIALHIRGGEIIFSDSRRLPGWEVVEDRYFPYEIAYELIIKELDNKLKIVIFGQDLKANKILKQYFAKSNCVYTIDDFIDKDMQDVERTFFDVNFMSKAKKIYSARESVFSKCAMMISGTNNLISYHDIFQLEDQFDIIQKNVYKLNLHDLHKAMSYFRLYRISRILQMDIKKSLEFINQASVLDKDNDAYLIYTIDCYFEMKEYQKINDMLKNILLYRKDKFLRNMFDISRYSFDKEYQNYINFNSHSYPYINFMIAMVCAWLGYNEKSIIFNFYISSQNIDENLKQALKKFINTKIQEHLNVNNYLKAQLNYKIGLEILDFLKNKQNFFILIKKISFLIKEDKKQKEIYKQAVQNDPSLKLPSLELYPDYKEAAKIQNHLSYKLGEAFLKCYKSKYKISYIKLPWNIFKAWKEFDK